MPLKIAQLHWNVKQDSMDYSNKREPVHFPRRTCGYFPVHLKFLLRSDILSWFNNISVTG